MASFKQTYIDDHFHEAATCNAGALLLLTAVMAALVAIPGWYGYQICQIENDPAGYWAHWGMIVFEAALALTGLVVLFWCLGGWFFKIRPRNKVAGAAAEPGLLAPTSALHRH